MTTMKTTSQYYTCNRSYRRFQRALNRLLWRAGIGSTRSGLPSMGGADHDTDLSPRMRRVQEFVELNIGDVRALDDLSEVAGLSRYHFARRFRNEVGEAPWAYVRRMRAERACQLLMDGMAPAEVAHEAGFADQAHLTRAMRERFGRTPGQLRREAASRKR